jgi:hypothetical protein
MTTKVTPLGLRLFLEGVEVPVISAQVNAAPDQPATAAIQVVPTDMGLYLLPRTLVHLFYLDSFDEGESLSEAAPRQAEDGSFREANFNRFDAPDTRYKLLFAGEVSGFNYGKNPSSRQLILQCHDLSTYWDTCYQWFADYSVGGGGLTDKSQIFIGAGESLFNSVAGGHKWVIGQLMREKPDTPVYRETPGLLGSIIHLLEAVGGTPGIDGFNGVNDFFSIAQLRYNLIGMIGALAADKTSARIYNQKAFFSWLRNGMTSLGTIMSFRDIINHVNKYIYHHIYPNVCPKIDMVADIRAKLQVPTTTFRSDVQGLFILQRAKNALTALSKASEKILPEITIKDVAQTLSFIREARRILESAIEAAENLKTDDAASISASLNGALEAVKLAILIYEDTGFKDEPESIFLVDAELSGDTEPEISLGQVAEGVKPRIQEAQGILIDDIISRSADASNPPTKVVNTTIKGAEGARLYTQLFLPECYFVAPPRCNVLFPDQYFQFSFSRNFMREVSRLSMGSGPGMIAGGGRQGSKLFTRHYVAPNIRDTRGKHAFTTTSRGARIILPHEVHSGIIPKYEWANDGHRWANLAKKSGRDPTFDGGKVGYLQRLANFQFYLHRWSARTMAVTGVFNPHLVIGFPGLVIDQSLPSPAVLAQREELTGRKWMPSQYLGKLVALSHSINQGGGQTSAQYTHCRTHRGLDDEFLNTLSRETVETKTEQVIVKIDVRELLGTSLTSTIKNQEDKKTLVRKYMEGKLGSGRRVRETRAWRGYKVASIDEGPVTELSRSEAAEFGLDAETSAVIEREVGSEEILEDTGFSSEPVGAITIIREEVEVLVIPETLTFVLERAVKVGDPPAKKETIESQLTPGWFSNLWTNNNISEKVYQPLLGTDAIVEKVSLGADEQNKFFDRLLKDENIVTAQEPPEGEGEDKKFSSSEAATIEGATTKVQVIRGSIEEAIDSIVTIYSTLRLRDGDIHDFIRQYTKRPVANIEEMLGTYGLQFDDDGNVFVPVGEEAPIEGFHSRAFGDYNADVTFPTKEGGETQAGKDALKALFTGAPGTKVSRGRVSNKKKETKLRPELDPRGRARIRVLAYVRELTLSRGLMG